MTLRVGVLSDTHVGEYLPALPQSVYEALAGVDLIIHCGDLSSREVIGELEHLAPVYAVAGNHDAGINNLPRRIIITIGGYRFGVIHGDGWGFARNLPLAALNLVFWRWAALGSAALTAASLAVLMVVSRGPAPNTPLVAKLEGKRWTSKFRGVSRFGPPPPRAASP